MSVYAQKNRRKYELTVTALSPPYWWQPFKDENLSTTEEQENCLLKGQSSLSPCSLG